MRKAPTAPPKKNAGSGPGGSPLIFPNREEIQNVSHQAAANAAVEANTNPNALAMDRESRTIQ
jgi:hypothetical protein